MPFTVMSIPRTFTSTTLFPGPAEMRVLSSPSPQNPVCLCLSWPKEVLSVCRAYMGVQGEPAQGGDTVANGTRSLSSSPHSKHQVP